MILRNCTTALINKQSIETTETRAKEIQKIAEKIIGKAVAVAEDYTEG
jgi:ribosomal protein L17